MFRTFRLTDKFHFWSGAANEYTITKNGTSIAGTAS
ncbi:hypothetical protein [Paenibacillus sp. NEAU-GSW1]